MGILYTLQTSLSNHRPRRSTPNHFLQFFIHPTCWGYLSNRPQQLPVLPDCWKNSLAKNCDENKMKHFFTNDEKNSFLLRRTSEKLIKAQKGFWSLLEMPFGVKIGRCCCYTVEFWSSSLHPFYDVTEYLSPLNPWSLQGSSPEVDKFSFGLFWRCKVLVRQFLAETQNNECLKWATSSLAFAKFQPSDKIPLMLKNHAA